jgi:phospholipid-binding lipoprotein MlaA
MGVFNGYVASNHTNVSTLWGATGRFMKNFHHLLFVYIALFISFQKHVKAEEIDDPIEPVNRGIFWFNDQLDIYALEPIASGYDYITPEFMRTGFNNFFGNLRYPSYLVSDLVQLKFTQAAEHTGRFLINTTIGLFGLIDIAKHVGLEDHREDFGIALAYHDVPPGPYLVLPLLGPSNLRDGVGSLVDFFLDPFAVLGLSSHVDASVKDKVILPLSTIRLINTRANLLEAVEAAKSSSVDYYLFMQSAYYQYREGVLNDGSTPKEAGVDLDSDPFGDEEEVVADQTEAE